MNIFILDWDPATSARWHCDKHIVKMPVETAQILSAALIVYHDVAAPYRPTHERHPCTVWASQSIQNFLYTCHVLDALGREYSRRYNRAHRSWEVLPDLLWGALQVRCWPEDRFTPPAQAMPDEYRDPDTVRAYQSYYIHEKRAIARYDRCPDGEPIWLQAGIPLSTACIPAYADFTQQSNRGSQDVN